MKNINKYLLDSVKETLKCFNQLSYEETCLGGHDFIVETIYGNLRVSLHKVDRYDKVAGVFTQIVEPNEKTNELLNDFSLNQFTYKYNFHSWTKDEAEVNRMLLRFNEYMNFLKINN